MAVAVLNTPLFLSNIPGQQWEKVGSLDMSDPAQHCPPTWQKITSPRASCGKITDTSCDSVNISTTGGSYQQVCGRFRGYQVGTPDAFNRDASGDSNVSIESYYVDGISITYGSPGNRHHVYTYAVGYVERMLGGISCPCAGGTVPPQFVGSDYYCESGCPNLYPSSGTILFHCDVLWDGQQCGGNEITCCSPPNLPWFCKAFPAPISEDLEVRICTDQTLYDENVALEFFELYILSKSVNLSAC